MHNLLIKRQITQTRGDQRAAHVESAKRTLCREVGSPLGVPVISFKARQLTKAQSKTAFSNGHDLRIHGVGEQTVLAWHSSICLAILHLRTGFGFYCLASTLHPTDITNTLHVCVHNINI